MKIKEGFELRRIGNESIIVARGIKNINFGSIISMNSSSAWLWEQVAEEEFDEKKLAELLLSKYSIDTETARQDAKEVAEQWLAAGIVEE